MFKKSMTITFLIFFIVAGYVAADYIKDANERVKAANWSKMETININLDEYKFTPSVLTFKIDIPYKLHITNVGSQKHYFTSEGFFKAIATRKIQSSDGEIKAPYFNAIEVFPGRSLDLYFIPVKRGNYVLICTIKGHSDAGMVGDIQIQ
jgi:uncharacterized cupredoxin-like copper-binding protein